MIFLSEHNSQLTTHDLSVSLSVSYYEMSIWYLFYPREFRTLEALLSFYSCVHTQCRAQCVIHYVCTPDFPQRKYIVIYILGQMFHPIYRLWDLKFYCVDTITISLSLHTVQQIVSAVSGWRSWKRLELSITLLADRVSAVPNCRKTFSFKP